MSALTTSFFLFYALWSPLAFLRLSLGSKSIREHLMGVAHDLAEPNCTVDTTVWNSTIAKLIGVGEVLNSTCVTNANATIEIFQNTSIQVTACPLHHLQADSASASVSASPYQSADVDVFASLVATSSKLLGVLFFAALITTVDKVLTARRNLQAKGGLMWMEWTNAVGKNEFETASTILLLACGVTTIVVLVLTIATPGDTVPVVLEWILLLNYIIPNYWIGGTLNVFDVQGLVAPPDFKAPAPTFSMLSLFATLLLTVGIIVFVNKIVLPYVAAESDSIAVSTLIGLMWFKLFLLPWLKSLKSEGYKKCMGKFVKNEKPLPQQLRMSDNYSQRGLKAVKPKYHLMGLTRLVKYPTEFWPPVLIFRIVRVFVDLLLKIAPKLPCFNHTEKNLKKTEPERESAQNPLEEVRLSTI